MNSRHCCHRTSTARSEQPPPSTLRHFRHAAEWAIPGALLVLMPKCPLCLAACVALFTGVGLSFSAAAHLRLLMLSLCVITLTVLIGRWVWTQFSCRMASR